ncbi:hypothetical protein CICLE_v10010246mg [Citrus x clementina]|uniref:Uncharacterized protein n=1 Tax=Citrus clementina TaxID=85681 RepID=V4UM12_CITCL|nr:hypothetical protein CICLE_v10010246mg [Citrus x clementina]
MPGNRVSDGTRFPVSNSCATGLFSSLDTFEDQIVPFAWLRRTRFPLLLLAKTPCGSRIGVFLLATQTTVSWLIWYHIPKYMFFELPGDKKPSSNL